MSKNTPALLPILIIPGFMSSGLEIQDSKHKPEWIGERIWINLVSLGFSSLYFSSAATTKSNHNTGFSSSAAAADEGDLEAQQQNIYKSSWMQHMALQPNMRTEHDGVIVRPISGLEGVDYLTPGALTNLVSYVFGPVIAALKLAGYTNESLEAAPYDWRLPPMELEARDKYFTRTMKQVEQLYKNNNSTPVVLLCHSLGTKTCHYFMNFAKSKKGKAWIDQYVYAYLPVGAPHLGAPKSLRSVISGDKMGLDAFLGDEEALRLGRSFGSGPWLFPESLPDGVPPCVYVRPQGVLEVTFEGNIDSSHLVNKRKAISKPNRYQLVVALGSNKRIVATPFRMASGQDVVSFAGDTIYFATSTTPSTNNSEQFLQFLLQEPGISAMKAEHEEVRFNPFCCILKCITCCWICDLIYRIVRCVTCGLIFKPLALSMDIISSAVGGSSTLAISEPFPLTTQVWQGKKTVTKTLDLIHQEDYGGWLCPLFNPRKTTIKVHLKWRHYNNQKSFRQICSPIALPSSNGDDECPLKFRCDGIRGFYQDFDGYDIMEREGLMDILRVVKDVYDDDVELGPRTISSRDPPPIKRVHAIYGINLPTETAAVFNRKDTCLAHDVLQNLYKLDTEATMAVNKGYSVKGGIVMETKDSLQRKADGTTCKASGDGTVPYWSLQHVKTWQGPCEVSFVELEGADHREILADPRFHTAVIDYCKQGAAASLNNNNGDNAVPSAAAEQIIGGENSEETKKVSSSTQPVEYKVEEVDETALVGPRIACCF